MPRDADVFIVIDTSRSMLAASAAGAPTRFERATAIAKRLRDATPTAAVGIASLTDRVLPHLFPTEDRADFDVTLRDAIAVQRPPPAENIGGSGTSLAALGDLATARFFAPEAQHADRRRADRRRVAAVPGREHRGRAQASAHPSGADPARERERARVHPGGPGRDLPAGTRERASSSPGRRCSSALPPTRSPRRRPRSPRSRTRSPTATAWRSRARPRSASSRCRSRSSRCCPCSSCSGAGMSDEGRGRDGRRRVLLAGCGGGGWRGELGQPVGSGADRAWVLRPEGTPKSVVVFVHGLGGPQEIEPTNHLPWLRHLVEQGNAVIYPAYETEPGGTEGRRPHPRGRQERAARARQPAGSARRASATRAAGGSSSSGRRSSGRRRAPC